jgi:hypothetical protein
MARCTPYGYLYSTLLVRAGSHIGPWDPLDIDGDAVSSSLLQGRRHRRAYGCGAEPEENRKLAASWLSINADAQVFYSEPHIAGVSGVRRTSRSISQAIVSAARFSISFRDGNSRAAGASRTQALTFLAV